MATFTGSVSYSLQGNAIDLADNDFRIIEQNGTLGQSGIIDITDMYPSANFTFGFDLTASEDPGTTRIPFVLSFYDTETRFNFTFNTNATDTTFSVVMENTVEGTIQTYTLFSGTKPTLYPASATKVLIRLLNGFLWVKVGSTFWLNKLDIQAHPLHLEGGIIQFSLTNTTVLVSHRIQNIYFEPILHIHDPTYFGKSIFAERYENFTVSDITDPTNLLLDPADLVVDVAIGSIVLDYVGTTFINDPTFLKSGTVVNRNDYKAIANELGIPSSQPTFTLPGPKLRYEWIENPPAFLQVNSDWNATSGPAQILNKPTIVSSQWTTTAQGIAYNGRVNIHAGNPYAVPNNFMATGSLTIGDLNVNYGGGTNWNTSTAGLMMECLDNTEIAFHDTNTRIASAMYYNGANNHIIIGRNMGWGRTGVIPYFANNLWHQCANGNNRFWFQANDRTYFGSQNGYEWRNSGDGFIASLDNGGNFVASGQVQGAYLRSTTGTSDSIRCQGGMTGQTTQMLLANSGGYWFSSGNGGSGAIHLCQGHWDPHQDNTWDLGSSINRWRYVRLINNPLVYSDARRKCCIQNSPLGLAFINDLRPVAYKLINGKNKATPKFDEEGRVLTECETTSFPGERIHYGLIAQEVKEAVNKAGVADFGGWYLDDKNDPDSLQSLAYESFIAPMIKAIQELSAKVAELEAKLSNP